MEDRCAHDPCWKCQQADEAGEERPSDPLHDPRLIDTHMLARIMLGLGHEYYKEWLPGAEFEEIQQSTPREKHDNCQSDDTP